uniref:hypothetical protein n=1 Tax=Pseudomonas aeruginosa TaxID=287 RepID=UPI003CFB9819
DQNKVMVEKIEETKAKHRAKYFKYIKTYTLVKTGRGFPSGSLQVKNPPEMQELQVTWVQSLGREDLLEKEMVTHFSCANPKHRNARYVHLEQAFPSAMSLWACLVAFLSFFICNAKLS